MTRTNTYFIFRVCFNLASTASSALGEMMNDQTYNLYRHYYYYDALSAWKGEAAMGCPSVTVI